ncbi:MAG: EamA family transporter RarD [Clostridia bacterium]|nr:EamA family transporter RarD [Clostridia bacterium]
MEDNSLNQVKKTSEYTKGLLTCLGCQTLWGFLVLYWDALNPIPSSTVIFYRVFLVGLISTAFALGMYGWKEYRKIFSDKKAFWGLTLTGTIITCNWSLYIWAVKAGFVIQTCVGYFIEPLVVAAFGIIFFREKLSKFKIISFSLALIGLIVILIHFREVPSIALGLAVTFAVYAALQKNFDMPSMLMLSYETVLLAIPALVIVIYLEVTGQGALSMPEVGAGKYLLMLCCGPLTALPLFLFGVAATRVELIMLGILEYISPSISLILGIFVLHEAFDGVQFISFVIVWIGLVFFTVGEVKDRDRINKLEE